MWGLKLSVLVTMVCGVYGDQHQFHVILENITLDFVDRNYMDAECKLSDINGTNAMDFMLKLKIDMPYDAKMNIKGYRVTSSGHQALVLNIRKNIKEFLQMSLFGVQTLFEEQIRPPLRWPIRKNAEYRMQGFILDSTKFPPNLPAGRWKTEIIEEFANRTKIVAYSVHYNLKYYK